MEGGDGGGGGEEGVSTDWLVRASEVACTQSKGRRRGVRALKRQSFIMIRNFSVFWMDGQSTVPRGTRRTENFKKRIRHTCHGGRQRGEREEAESVNLNCIMRVWILETNGPPPPSCRQARTVRAFRCALLAECDSDFASLWQKVRKFQIDLSDQKKFYAHHERYAYTNSPAPTPSCRLALTDASLVNPVPPASTPTPIPLQRAEDEQCTY